jgi:hypothetical protein
MLSNYTSFQRERGYASDALTVLPEPVCPYAKIVLRKFQAATATLVFQKDS